MVWGHLAFSASKLGFLAAAMAWSWIRADAREARRYDRKAARDGDAELAAYNAHLERLKRSTKV